MPGNGHVRFGRRAAETGRQKRRHRAAARPHNLVADPGFLLVAWDRVRGNKGAATAGVDGQTAASIAAWKGVEDFLDELRWKLKDRSFTPLPVRQRMILRQAASCARWGWSGNSNTIAKTPSRNREKPSVIDDTAVGADPPSE